MRKQKQQTFIAFFESKDGKRIDFERFCCKRIDTAKKYIGQLWENSLYRACTKGAEVVKIYATPDGVNKEPVPAAIIELA